jgi:serine/threonine protein kinase
VLEELELTDDCGLRCNRCQRQFWSTPKTRDAILEATLRRDPACRGCAFEHSRDAAHCRQLSVFLNFFRNRVLLLERLDLDLDDYFRWQRGSLPVGSRKVAQQAFHDHLLVLHERRERLPGPSVRKIAELLRVADLFSDVLAGVQHLHDHDIAHLDLKLANVCVRFRGADLDVKIIDLGLSDDPHTLAYLRQAEGPLSLWTDYSAPEFRRPRPHPVAVDGRFTDDRCELDWPSPEASPELPCAGDLLFFEDRYLPHQRWRVVGVRPTPGGWLQVQAQAEPEHRLWRGDQRELPHLGPEAKSRLGLGVVLEKHCGFPADVYSLGMLLLAILGGRPAVGDFREALPGIQIELEDQLGDATSLPGRALVQRLLSRPSKHLHVFQAYAQRLSEYGIAQPLAEELLGMVLRATLRGNSRVFYLQDRGADARPAMQRLRADLDAVRNAARNAFTTAWAASVREGRLAVLDRLRGMISAASPPAGTHPRGIEVRPPRLEPTERLIYPTLDLGAAGDGHCVGELAYLSPPAAPSAGGCPSKPDAVLDRWERELSGVGGGLAAGRAWDFLLHYCRTIDLSSAEACGFLDRYQGLAEQVAQAGLPMDLAEADERERARRWLDDHEALAERTQEGLSFVTAFREFTITLEDKLLIPWDRGLRSKALLLFRRSAVQVPLRRPERLAVRNEDIEVGLKRLARVVQEGQAAQEQRRLDFERVLASWRAWRSGRSWLEAVSRVEAEAVRQWRSLQSACADWDENWHLAVDRLRRYLAEVTKVLQAYDELLSPEPAEEIYVRLTRLQRQALELHGAAEALAWLEQHWPTPGDRLEGLFALWELGSPGG